MNADSNYVYLKTILPELSKQSPETLWLVFFPDPEYGSDTWRYTPDGLQSDRIKFVSWPYDTQMSTSVIGFDPARFHEIETKYAPTMYWLHQVELGAFIAGGYARSWSDLSTPALVAHQHYIIHRSLPYPYESMFPRQWLQIGGSLSSDTVVYETDYCRKMAEESFTELITEKKWQEIEKKSVVLPVGVLSGLEPRAPIATADDQPVFIYNHRFERYKQPEVTFSILNELRKHYKFEIWATQTPGQRTGGSYEFYFDKSIFAPKRIDYLNKIAIPAINTINSLHETFCISIVDSMALGHLIVVPNALTFPEIVPKGYPFLFNSPDEQRAMLTSILDNWPEDYNRWRNILQTHAHKLFASKDIATNYMTILSNAENMHRKAGKKATTEASLTAAFNALRPDAPTSPEQFRRIFAHLHSKGIGNQSFPTRRFVREAAMDHPEVAIVWDNGVKLVKLAKNNGKGK
jgi:glycosyltransferase involved in cell wall biosynthesis